MNGWSQRLATLAAPRLRVLLALSLVMVSVSALAAERAEVRSAERVVNRGEQLVALMDDDEPGAHRALRQYLMTSSDPLVLTWAAAALVGRSEEGPELVEVRLRLQNRLVSLSPDQAVRQRYLSVMPDIDDLIAKRLVVLAGTDPKQVLQFAQSSRVPIPVEAIDALAAGQQRWLVDLMLTSKIDQERRGAASMIPAVLERSRDRRLVRAYLGQLHPPEWRDEGAAEIPWENGALYVPAVQWRPHELGVLTRTLFGWSEWARTFNQPVVHQQAINALRVVNPALAAM